MAAIITAIQVSQDPSFRRSVAEAIVNEAHPGYHGMGAYWADLTNGKVIYREANAAWDPWDPSAVVVACTDLVAQDGNDFSGAVDWDLMKSDLPYTEMLMAYIEDAEEELEADGSTPEWVQIENVIAFARDKRPEWAESIEEIEKIAQEEAIAFVLREIVDEIRIQDSEY